MAKQSMMGYFMAVVIVMLFYSVSINIITYTLPDALKEKAVLFDNNIDMSSVKDDIEGAVESQTDIPVIDLGALVYYSGNIVLDLLMNFIYAIPQMFTFLIYGISQIFGGLDPVLMGFLEMFLVLGMTITYFIGLIQLIMGFRTGDLL